MGKNEILEGAALIAQAGGPTAVINASAYGVIKTALAAPQITRVFASSHGITGVVNDKLFDMNKEDPAELALLLQTPAAAFGSCRYKLKVETDYAAIVRTIKKHNIRYFFYNGGNDSMDTCSKVNTLLQEANYECRVIGVPKTIDNDLWATDHTPGYASAAKYIATTCSEMAQDCAVYNYSTVTIAEVMGRNAGWLTAASALATKFGPGPDLIYLPEASFDLNSFLNDVDRVRRTKKDVFVTVSEGVRDRDGKYITEYAKEAGRDAFGHAQLGGLATFLAAKVKERTGDKVRAVEFSIMQRCASHIASKTDVQEAFRAGEYAVNAALRGENGKMAAFECKRENGKYTCGIVLVPTAEVANLEKKVPAKWINKAGNFVTDEFIDYALPLIQGEVSTKFENGLPRYARLKKVPVK